MLQCMLQCAAVHVAVHIAVHVAVRCSALHIFSSLHEERQDISKLAAYHKHLIA